MGYEKYIYNVKFKPMKKPNLSMPDKHMVIAAPPIYHNKLNNFRMIPRFPNYFVHPNGNIYNNTTGDFLKPTFRGKNGYPVVDIKDYSGLYTTRSKPLHRIIAYTWIPNDDYERYYIIDHIDGNKQNFALSNLRWVDHSGNLNNSFITNSRTDNYRVLTYNIKTGENKIHASLTQACEYIGRSRINTIQQPLLKNKIWKGSNGLFKIIKFDNNDGEEKSTPKINLKTKLILGTNGKEIFKAKTIKEMSSLTGIPKSTITKFLSLNLNYNEWKFKRDDGTMDFSTVNTRENIRNKPQSIIVENKITGDIKNCSSLRLAEQLTGITRKSILTIINNFNGETTKYRFKLILQKPTSD